MKRLLVRISVLVVVVVLGLFAIAQAQRQTEAPRKFSEPGHANPLRPAAPSHAAEPITAQPAAAFEADGDSSYPVPASSQPPSVFDAWPQDPNRAAEPVTSGAPAFAPDDSSYAPNTAPPADLAEAEPVNSLRPGVPESMPSFDSLPAANPSASDPYSPPAATAAPAGSPQPLDTAPSAGRNVFPPPPGANAFDMASVGASPTPLGPPMAPSNPEPMAAMPAIGGGASSGGTGTPGTTALEGAQTPQLTIEKLAPAEIQVGKPAVFKVVLRNTGSVAAQDVEIHDEVPRGTRLLSTTPSASVGSRSELVWPVGTLKPGDEVTAEIELMPTDEGEIGSVASVRFAAEASARTLATKPELVVEAVAPAQVLLGQQATVTITVTNPGSGVATGVVLQEQVPQGLTHPAGTELEYEVGQLKPKESRQLQLVLTAQSPGTATNLLVLRGDGNLRAESQLAMEVISPQLDVVIDGPTRRYLEREATYTVAISNPGTAPAKNVLLSTVVPPGMKFVRANNAGQYDEASRTVRWQLEELPIREQGSVQLTVIPTEMGQQVIQAQVTSTLGVKAQQELPVEVDGIAAILFQVADIDDPIEVGKEAHYEIHVVNQGSKAATNVQLTVLLPPEMRPVAAEGPTRYTIENSRVVFEGLSRLAPKADTTYRVRVQGLQPGDLRVRVQLTTDEIRTPVTKEELTKVYQDQ